MLALGAVERLDLALLVNRQHRGVGRRVDTEPDDIRQLGGEARIARALEGAQPVGLQFVRPLTPIFRSTAEDA